MPRGLTVGQKAAIAGARYAPRYLVELELSGAAYVRLWTGVGDVVCLGATWQGVGELGLISGVEASRDLTSRGISVTLAGVPSAALAPGAIAAMRAQRYQGRGLTVYLAFASPDTGALLHDPVAIWSGAADVMTFALGETVTCTLTGEHHSSRLRRSNGARMTTADHNLRLGRPASPDLFYEASSRLAGIPRQALA